MSKIPDFTKIALETQIKAAAPPEAAATSGGAIWETPEGIPVKPVYTGADTAGLDHLDTLPGFAPFVRGPYPAMYALQPGSRRRKIPTPSIAATSLPAKRVFLSPSISPRIAATTAITRASKATSAWRALRLTASTTCARCSTAFRSLT
jgi:hypothetical protein